MLAYLKFNFKQLCGEEHQYKISPFFFLKKTKPKKQGNVNINHLI